MPDQTIAVHEYANGLTLVAEVMPDVQSAALSFMVPGGAVYDPAGKNGTACRFHRDSDSSFGQYSG